MSYPKWVQRAAHIGAVLCQDEAEEKKLLADYDAEQKATAAAADEAALLGDEVPTKDETAAKGKPRRG